jgi:uncharacterized protein YjlB
LVVRLYSICSDPRTTERATRTLGRGFSAVWKNFPTNKIFLPLSVQLEQVVDLRGAAGVVGGGGGGGEVEVEGGDHRFHAGVAVGCTEVFRETGLDDLQRDVR